MTASPRENPERDLADRFVTQTDCNLFLTGKAGTGKTTFLKDLPRKTDKRLIVTAPTGVAAINAGGVTLHSFFQLPLGPYLPNSGGHEGDNRRYFKLNSTKKAIINSLDLLIIDEISMVRADLLDSVDAVLRRIRKSQLPFGGVQLLMIGDLYQLPPIVKHDEWELLRQSYDTAYFFSSQSLRKAGFMSIELKHVYRQSDDRFIRILNQLRYNQLDEASLQELNRQVNPDLSAQDTENHITLTTHNRKAEAINQTRLQALSGEEHTYTAKTDGDFPKQVVPAPESLQLKKGARVMFLRNDNSEDKRYFNGKIGKVTRCTHDLIEVTCPGESTAVSVEPASWENVRYALNPKTAEIETNIVGTFKQYPLKLAWGITIHKSQGLTFDKAIIDCEAAFSPGQTYVALSRCRTLAGVVLKSPIPAGGINVDPVVAAFSIWIRENPASIQHLETAQAVFQQKLLRECFDFGTMSDHLNQVVRLTKQSTVKVITFETVDWEQVRAEANRDLFEVGRNFTKQLERLFQTGACPESDAQIIERIGKASAWYQDKMTTIFGTGFKNSRFETNNSILKQRLQNRWRLLLKEIKVKHAAITSLENGFNPVHYLRQVSLAELDSDSPTNKPRRPLPAPKSNHPELANELNEWRQQEAERRGIGAHHLIHLKTVTRVADTIPANLPALKNIKGIGRKTIQKYGNDIIEIVTRYRQRHGLTNQEEDKSDAWQVQKDMTDLVTKTKQASFDLLNSGLTIKEIAQKRGLVQSTIEGHLCAFIELGLLDINRLMSAEKQEIIRDQLKREQGNSLSAVKEELGEAVSYGEIKMVLASENSLNGSRL